MSLPSIYIAGRHEDHTSNGSDGDSGNERSGGQPAKKKTTHQKKKKKKGKLKYFFKLQNAVEFLFMYC